MIRQFQLIAVIGVLMIINNTLSPLPNVMFVTGMAHALTNIRYIIDAILPEITEK